MSCNSPWSSTDLLQRRRCVTTGMALAASWLLAPAQATASTSTTANAGTAAALPPPPAAPGQRETLTHQGITLLPRGEGRLRFFGLEIYTARLWVAEGFEPDQHARHPLALELAYARHFSARDIAERSLQEMKRQTHINQAREADWTSKLAAVMPDVKPGTRLLGFHRPQQGALFQLAGHTLGTVDDPVFSALFFGIWLSTATSEPALRTALLTAR